MHDMQLWGDMSWLRVIDEGCIGGVTHRGSYVCAQPTPCFPLAVIVPVMEALMQDIWGTTKYTEVWEAPKSFLSKKQTIWCFFFVASDGSIVKSNHLTNSNEKIQANGANGQNAHNGHVTMKNYRQGTVPTYPVNNWRDSWRYSRVYFLALPVFTPSEEFGRAGHAFFCRETKLVLLTGAFMCLPK